MKKFGFKNKYSSLSRGTGLKKSSKSMKKFREVTGEDENVLQVHEADSLFSKQIRKRDGQCVNCGSTLFLGCSHYFGRAIYATRYDPLNCICLCTSCHELWEHEKDGVYKDYMIMWIGEEEFKALKERANEKVSPYDSIVAYMKLSATLQDNDIEY